MGRVLATAVIGTSLPHYVTRERNKLAPKKSGFRPDYYQCGTLYIVVGLSFSGWAVSIQQQKPVRLRAGDFLITSRTGHFQPAHLGQVRSLSIRYRERDTAG